MVIGAGAARLSAAMEAVKNGVPTQVFGRKESLRVELETAGIIYRVLPDAKNRWISLNPTWLKPLSLSLPQESQGKKRRYY